MTDELKAEREDFENAYRAINEKRCVTVGMGVSKKTGEYHAIAAQDAWELWQARAKLDRTPQAAPPSGWLWYSADLSCLCSASSRNPRAIVGFIRDIHGQAWWHSLSEEEKETTGLYVYAEGKDFNEAFDLACNLIKNEAIATYTAGGDGDGRDQRMVNDAHLNAAKGEAVAWRYRFAGSQEYKYATAGEELVDGRPLVESQPLYTNPASPDVVRDADAIRSVAQPRVSDGWKNLGAIQIDSVATGRRLVSSYVVGDKIAIHVTDNDDEYRKEIDAPWVKKLSAAPAYNGKKDET